MNPNRCTVRLVETKGQPSQILTWCSLSYVWGGDQPVKTTKSTLKDHYAGIQLSRLPPTLQDAVRVCGGLNISHLWVDSLCIIQDDPEDLVGELAVMPHIYQYASVTISAACASSVEEGFLHNRPIYYRDQPPTGILYRNLADQEEIAMAIYPSNRSMHFVNVDHLDLIEARGWTYQERILSPRLLLYSSQELLWYCRMCKRCDGGTHEYYKLRIVEGDDSSHRDIFTDRIPCVLGFLMQLWNDVVSRYSHRALTYSSDKLVAISAVAKTYQEEHQKTYLAGLWREDLPEDLLWHVPPYSSILRKHLERRRRLTAYRAPSWSWASVDGGVMFLNRNDGDNIKALVEILDAKTALVMARALLGAVSGGHIKTRGRMRSFVWHYNRQEAELDGDIIDIYPDAKEDGWSGDEDASMPVWVLPVLETTTRYLSRRQDGLLLLHIGTDEFRRVGRFSIRVGGDEQHDVFYASGFETREIIII
ncbi:HET-domain-containing protein [Stipitochalara longipes BDJ]|nr:HET-domain-containing protein [Stipitochalara longipes BDJ]